MTAHHSGEASIAIAIDGPAGAGKSTLSRLLAESFHLRHINTGACYRAFAWFVVTEGQSAEDSEAVERLLADFELKLGSDGSVEVNGHSIAGELHTSAVSSAASKVAKLGSVRTFMVAWQQAEAAKADAVMEGRDIGTVVLPNAPVKFYITADAEVRARRRHAQLEDQSKPESMESILDGIRERDERDTKRKNSPLKQAEDAVLIDTSQDSIEESLRKMQQVVTEKLGLGVRLNLGQKPDNNVAEPS